MSALGLKDYIGRISFHHITHMVFPGGLVTSGSRKPIVGSIDNTGIHTFSCFNFFSWFRL